MVAHPGWVTEDPPLRLQMGRSREDNAGTPWRLKVLAYSIPRLSEPKTTRRQPLFVAAAAFLGRPFDSCPNAKTPNPAPIDLKKSRLFIFPSSFFLTKSFRTPTLRPSGDAFRPDTPRLPFLSAKTND